GVVGGDLSRAPVLMAAVTALGDFEGRRPVTRSGARPGDVIAYAGELGLSALGLRVLFAQPGATPDDLVALRERHPIEIRAHLTPRPPVELGASAALAGATAMLDVSDGLALDGARIARASGVTLDFSTSQLVAAFGSQTRVSVPREAMLF